MRRAKTNQDGFGAVEIIIACLVIVVLGAAGAVLLRHHKSNTKAATTPTTTQTQTPQTTSTAQSVQPAPQYLVIKEWGVQLTLDGSTSSLYYYINPKIPDVAYLSLKTVSDIAPNCAADKVSLAAIGRLTETQQQAAVTSPSVLNKPGTTHIANYWYDYSKPNAGCVDTSAQSDAISKAQPAYDLQTTFKTLQATSSSN